MRVSSTYNILGILISFIVGVFAPEQVFAACTSPAGTEGAIWYDNTPKKVKYCDDTNWVTLETTAAGYVLPDGSIPMTGAFLLDVGAEATPGLAFDGDPNTGIYRPADDELGFSTAGVEALRIDAVGNVGIGTTNPSEKLHIFDSGTSTVRYETGGASNDVNFELATPSKVWKLNVDGNASTGGADDTFYITEDGSYRIAIAPGGNLGVGTNSPNSVLTVEGAMTLDQLGADPTGTAGYGSLYTKTDGSLYYRDGTGTVTDLLNAGASTGSVLFNSTDIYTAGSLMTLTGGASSGLRNRITLANNLGGIKLQTANYDTFGANDIDLEVRNPTGTINLTGGNVGIGTTNPLVPLHVHSSTADGDLLIQSTNATGGNAVLSLWSMDSGATQQYSTITADFDGNMIFNSDTGLYDFRNAGGGASQMNIDASGNVAIGDISPNSKLTVEGAMTLDQLGADPAGAAGYGSLYTKTDGKLYYRDGTGTVTDLLAGGGGGLADVIDDTTPQLGGDLDVNGNDLTSTTGMNFAIGSSAGNDFTVDTDKLVVEGDTGHVGIGNPNPETHLSISGGVAAGNGVAIRLLNYNAANSNTWLLGTGGGVVPDDAFSIGDSSAYRMVIDSAGNVGIGNTDPLLDLHVTGRGRVGNSIENSDSGASWQILEDSNPYFTIDDFADNLLAFGVDSGSSQIAAAVGDIQFKTGHTWNQHPNATGSTRMVIKSDGNVGIGTTSPAGALDVVSTTGAFVPPRMTEAQRDGLSSPPNGSIVYNTTSAKLNVREGGSWSELGGGGGGSACTASGFGSIADAQVGTSTTYESDIRQITTFSCSADVQASGDGTPQFQICNNDDCSSVDHAWGSTTQTIDNDQYIQIRVTAPGTPATSNTGVFAVGVNVTSLTVEAEPPKKKVFVTANTYDGNLGGVSGADTICNTEAGNLGYSGTYKAWISESASLDPESTFTQSTDPYVRAGDTSTIIADNWTDLTDGTLDNSIGTGSSFVWTNTTSGGAYKGGTNCSGWSGTGGNGVDGSEDSTNSWWTDDGTSNCSSNNKLYCFEQ